MVIKDTEAKNRLVALARKKAENEGTTLESEVEAWLERYVNEPDTGTIRRIDLGSPTCEAPAPARAVIKRAANSISRPRPSTHSDRDTRSAAYRRLQSVISNS
ncbi:MAG: hypothetical protein AB8B97_25335 [Granulosicoccus sp.]